MQIYSVARNVLGALGPRVKVPVLDCKKKKQKIPQPQVTTRTAARACVIAV